MIQRKNCTMILDPESQGSVFFSSKNTVSTSFKSSTALASAVSNSMSFYYLLELQCKLDQWVELNIFAGPKKYTVENKKKPGIGKVRSSNYWMLQSQLSCSRAVHQ